MLEPKELHQTSETARNESRDVVSRNGNDQELSYNWETATETFTNKPFPLTDHHQLAFHLSQTAHVFSFWNVFWASKLNPNSTIENIHITVFLTVQKLRKTTVSAPVITLWLLMVSETSVPAPTPEPLGAAGDWSAQGSDRKILLFVFLILWCWSSHSVFWIALAELFPASRLVWEKWGRLVRKGDWWKLNVWCDPTDKSHVLLCMWLHCDAFVVLL